MEMVQIPLASIEFAIEHFEEKVSEYKALNLTEMEQWAEGRLETYKSILELWHTA